MKHSRNTSQGDRANSVNTIGWQRLTTLNVPWWTVATSRWAQAEASGDGKYGVNGGLRIETAARMDLLIHPASLGAFIFVVAFTLRMISGYRA
jgi:hypothetical protein